MARKSGLNSDLAMIALYAPMVMGARLQMLALETLKPTRKGHSEFMRMTTEKPLAMAEAALAAHASLVKGGLAVWNDLARGSISSLMAAPALSLAAAAVPVRRRVRRNARRLGTL